MLASLRQTGFLLLTSVSYVVIWQFFWVNIGRFDISRRRPQMEIETEKSKQYEVSYWTVYNSFNLSLFLFSKPYFQ